MYMHPEFAPNQSSPSERQALALVIVWSAREPHRIGEVALFPTEEGIWVLGRKPQSQTPGMPLRMRGQPVSFFRQRPAGASDRGQPAESGALLAGEGISRRQVEIFVQKDALRVHNIGRSPLHVNGVAVGDALVRPRDTLYLPNQIMFYCCHRPTELAPLRAYPAERAPYFGEPDQDGIVGESPAVWELRERLALSSGRNQPVIIKGACRIAREQAEQALSAMVAQDVFASAAELRKRATAHALQLDKPAPLGERSPLPPTEQALRLGVAVTEPSFQAVEVPGLNERPEDIPFILYHILRQQALDDDDNISPYFWMGLPRIHPSMIETLLHQFYSRHIFELTELALQAFIGRAGGAIGPLPLMSKARPRPASYADPEPSGSPRATAKRAEPEAAPPKPHRAKGTPSPARKSGSPSQATLRNSLESGTLAMLLREGLTIPGERRD